MPLPSPIFSAGQSAIPGELPDASVVGPVRQPGEAYYNGGQAVPITIDGPTDADTVGLVTLPGFDATVPATLSVGRVAGSHLSTGAWHIVNRAKATGSVSDPQDPTFRKGTPGQTVSFIRAARGTQVEYLRVVCPLQTPQTDDGYVWRVPRDGYAQGFPQRALWEGNTNLYIVAGQPFDVSLRCGYQHHVVPNPANGVGSNSFADYTLTPDDAKPAWVGVSTSHDAPTLQGPVSGGSAATTVVFARLTGTAPNTPGLYAFNVESSGKPISMPPPEPSPYMLVLSDTARIFLNVAPPDGLWTSNDYAAAATEGQPFGWSFADKVFAGSAVAILAGPVWLSIIGTNVTGTPPEGSGGNAFHLTLKATNRSAVQSVTLTVNVAPGPGPDDLWIGDPFSAVAVEGQPFVFPLAARLVAGANAATGANPPDWIALASNTVTGTPPTGSANTIVAVPLVASLDSATTDTTLSIYIYPSHHTSMFTNGPYSYTVTEGRQFKFTIALADVDASVTASNLPPWLIFDPVSLTFSGLPPIGVGGTVEVMGLHAVDGEASDNTTFTLTITQLAVLGITLDTRNNTVNFDGGPPRYKHGDSVVWLVNVVPGNQAPNLTGLKARIKDKGAYNSFGTVLSQDVCARVASTAQFQFAAITFANPRLNSLLALLDPVVVQQSVDFMVEFEYGLSGLRKTTLAETVTIERDFALDTSAGGTNASGGDAGDDDGNEGGGGGISTATGGVLSVPMILSGAVTNGQVFGFFKLPVGAILAGMQLDLQAPDPGAPVTVALLGDSGSPFGSAYSITSSAGVATTAVDFGASSLSLAGGSTVRCKITDYTPSSNPAAPAQFLTIQVLFRQ